MTSAVTVQSFTSIHDLNKSGSRAVAPPGGHCAGIFGWEDQHQQHQQHQPRTPGRQNNGAGLLQVMQQSNQQPTSLSRQYQPNASTGTHHLKRKNEMSSFGWNTTEGSRSSSADTVSPNPSTVRETDLFKPQSPTQLLHSTHPMEEAPIENVRNLLNKFNLEPEPFEEEEVVDDEPVPTIQRQSQQPQHQHHQQADEKAIVKEKLPRSENFKKASTKKTSTPKISSSSSTLKSKSKSKPKIQTPKVDVKNNKTRTPASTKSRAIKNSKKSAAPSSAAKTRQTKIKQPVQQMFSSPVGDDSQNTKPDSAKKLTAVQQARAKASMRGRQKIIKKAAEDEMEMKKKASFRNKFTSNHTSNRILAPPGGRSSLSFN